MNNLYVSLDLDHFGQLFGAAVLTDDLDQIQETDKKADAALSAIKQWAKFHNGEVINAGGDEALISIPAEAIDQIEDLKRRVEEASGTTVTIGIGEKPSQSSKSLLAGKLNGKDQIVQYSEEVDNFLQDAHKHAMSGEASEDEQKIEDHYLSHSDEFQDGAEGNEEPEIIDSDEEHDISGNPRMSSAPEQDSVNPEDAAQFEENDGIGEDVGQEYGEDEGGQGMDDSYGEEEAPANIEEEEPLPVEDDIEKNNSLLQPPEGENEQESQEWGGSEEDQPVADPEMQGEDYQEEPQEDQAPEDQNADPQTSDELKQAIAQNLEAFKQKKEVVEQIKEADPELYSAITGLLQNLIQLSQGMNQAMGKSQSPK